MICNTLSKPGCLLLEKCGQIAVLELYIYNIFATLRPKTLFYEKLKTYPSHCNQLIYSLCIKCHTCFIRKTESIGSLVIDIHILWFIGRLLEYATAYKRFLPIYFRVLPMYSWTFLGTKKKWRYWRGWHCYVHFQNQYIYHTKDMLI